MDFFNKGEASGLIGQEFSASSFKGRNDNTISGLILVISIFFSLSLLFILCLVNICCPNRHLYLKGIQRITKFNLNRIPRTADESGGLGLMLILVFITVFTYSVLIDLALNSDFWVLNSSFLSLSFIPTATLLFTVIYLQASREQWFNLGFWGVCGFALDHSTFGKSRTWGWLGRGKFWFNSKTFGNQSTFYSPITLDIRTFRNIWATSKTFSRFRLGYLVWIVGRRYICDYFTGTTLLHEKKQ